MKTVSRYENYGREKINRDRCRTLGSIYRIDLSCNRVSSYITEYAKAEDYRFGNVFPFKSEADRALIEVKKVYNSFDGYYGKANYYELIKNPVYIISDNGDITEVTKESVQDENRMYNRFGFKEYSFEQYIKSWYNNGNCFNNLERASLTRNKIADIFENVKIGKYN